jgi:hypothetical protein
MALPWGPHGCIFVSRRRSGRTVTVYAQSRRLVTAAYKSDRVDIPTPAEAEAERDEWHARCRVATASYDAARARAIADLTLRDAEWLADGDEDGDYRTCAGWSYTPGQEGGVFVFRCGYDGIFVSAPGVLRALRANDGLADVLRQVDRDEDVAEEWGA